MNLIVKLLISATFLGSVMTSWMGAVLTASESIHADSRPDTSSERKQELTRKAGRLGAMATIKSVWLTALLTLVWIFL